MKFLILTCLSVAVFAEPPRFRNARFRFQRQELAPTTTDTPTEATTDFQGYPAAGWKPSGQQFALPNEQAPDNQYGAPADSYGAPQKEAPYPASGWKPQGQQFTLPNEQAPPATSYGAPDNSYGPPDNPDAEPTTDNPQTEKLEGVDVQKSQGTYYILLPNGQLQRVEFMTENDVQKMAYTARLQLRERAPFFVFRP